MRFVIPLRKGYHRNDASIWLKKLRKIRSNDPRSLEMLKDIVAVNNIKEFFRLYVLLEIVRCAGITRNRT